MLISFPNVLRWPTVAYKEVIASKDQFLDFVNKYNGKTDVFLTVYAMTKTVCCHAPFKVIGTKLFCQKCSKRVQDLDLESPYIDCGFFDIDPDNFKDKEEMYEVVVQLNDLCKDTLAYLNFSGSGFHWYSKAFIDNNTKIEQKRGALREYQREIEEALGFVFDYTSHGDTSRVLRVPGSINPKHGNYCYSLQKLDGFQTIVDESYKFQEIAMRPIHQGNKVDLNTYISKIKNYSNVQFEGSLAIMSDDIKSLLLKYGIKYDEICVCVKKMFSCPFQDYNERFLFIKILKVWGLSIEDAKFVVSNVLWHTPDEKSAKPNERWNWARHCVVEEKQVNFVYKNNYDFPTCIYLRTFLSDYCSDCGRNILEIRAKK